VRFADVDPAGIAFYPRYFEMLNEAVEDWFDSLGWSFARMHLEGRTGVPARRIEADFTSPSWLGDTLDITLSVREVGRTSLRLEVAFTCAGAPRWTARMVLVMIDMSDGKATPWPDDLRAKLEGRAG
jgi:4-hydroxybenzoyl-CoA thioesterase